jgi:RPA family protein
MDVLPKRQTAYKVWVKDIHSSVQKKDNATSLVSFEINNKNVVRVNLVASIIESNVSGNYGVMVVDDGSAQVKLKVWNDDLWLLEDKQVGDFVLIIGRIAEFNNERYVRPEIIRNVSFDWALLRRLELIKEYGTPKVEEKVVVSVEEMPMKEVEPSLVAREIILRTVEKMDDVSEEDLIAACKMPKEKVLVAIYDLLKEGEIFSPQKGFYRLV